MKNKTLKGLLLVGIGIGVGIGVYTIKKNKHKKNSTKDLKKEKVEDNNILNREDVNYIDLSDISTKANKDYNNITNKNDDSEDILKTKEKNLFEFEDCLNNKENNNIEFYKDYKNNEDVGLTKNDFDKNYEENEINDSKTIEIDNENIQNFDIIEIDNESEVIDGVEDIATNEMEILEQNNLENVSMLNNYEKEIDSEDDTIKEELNDINLVENNAFEVEIEKDNIINDKNIIVEEKVDNSISNDLTKEISNDIDLTSNLDENCNMQESVVELDCIDKFKSQEEENLPDIGLLDYYMICKEFWVKDYKPSDLMLILESLYNKELITNPKSECRYVSSNIANNFDIILENLYTIDELKKYVEKITTKDIERVMEDKNYVDNFWVKDRRNEAIVPTSKIPNFDEITNDEKDVYLFIAKSFISIFLDNEENVKTKNNKVIGNECFITNEDIDEIENKLIKDEENTLDDEEKVDMIDEKSAIEEELKNINERKIILENNKKQGFLSTRDFIELSQELSSREKELLDKLNKLN